ncbi:hypothetical protein SUGI_0539220 [Cryptomeria japonica]|nr:hypothetical protein SUGI_0539220 [Cryptomeria japonica]
MSPLENSGASVDKELKRMTIPEKKILSAEKEILSAEDIGEEKCLALAHGDGVMSEENDSLVSPVTSQKAEGKKKSAKIKAKDTSKKMATCKQPTLDSTNKEKLLLDNSLML